MDFVSRGIGNAYLTPEVQLLLRVGYRVRLGLGPLDQLRLGAARKRGLHDVVIHGIKSVRLRSIAFLVRQRLRA
jgi:hypothetical protein